MKKGDIQMIMGGPPCQGFSGMNRHSKTAYSKSKNSHVVPYLSLCDFFRPNNFVLENVEKLMYYPSSDRHALVRMVLRVLLEMGYQCSVAVVQAATQGVPQSRTRTIFLASAPGHDLPHHPRPIHTFQRKEHRYSVSFSVGRNDAAAISGDTRMKVEVTATPKCRTPSLPLRFVRVRDILSDLPEVKNGDDERTAPKTYGKSPLSASQYRFRMTTPSHLSHTETETSRLDKAESPILHHYPRELSGLVWERARLSPKQHPGADWRDLPNHDIVTKERVYPAMKYSGLDEDAIQKFSHDYPQIMKLPRAVCGCMSIKNPSERAKKSGTRECRQFLRECVIPWSLPHTGVRHNQWQGLYGRLIEGGSSATIVTQPTLIGKQGTWLHPIQDRIITVREAARMQGFPDHFRFQGAITMMYKQIGNAVPPPLGRAIAMEVMKSEQNTAARRVKENEFKMPL
jgi:DNA (cytosine-5)-methyltransferase 1